LPGWSAAWPENFIARFFKTEMVVLKCRREQMRTVSAATCQKAVLNPGKSRKMAGYGPGDKISIWYLPFCESGLEKIQSFRRYGKKFSVKSENIWN